MDIDVYNGYWVRLWLIKSFLGKLSSWMRYWVSHRIPFAIYLSLPGFLSLSIYLGHLGWGLGIRDPFHLFLCLHSLCCLTEAVTSSWGGLLNVFELAGHSV